MIKALLILLLNLFNFWIVVRFRKANYISQFAARKIMHITTALGCLVAVVILSQYWYATVCLFFVLFYFALHFGKKTRVLDSENHKSLGVPLYPVGLAIMSIFLWDNRIIHILGILVLGIPDSLGAVVEEWVKPYASKYSRLIKFLVYYALTASLLIFGLSLPLALGVGLFLAVVESVSPYGFDNLTVPIAFAISILILNVV